MSKKIPKKQVQTSIQLETPKPFEISEKWIFPIFFVSVFLCYISIWGNEYVWDDRYYILLNQTIKKLSFENIKTIFTTYKLGNYHPITLLSWAIEKALIGEQNWLYKFDNLLLHSLNSWLIYKILRTLKNSFNLAFFVALLFAIHPFHVESVAWISERKDVLFVFFLLLSLKYYLKFDEIQKSKFYIFSIILFILSCLSKGMAVVLPAILVATDYFFLNKKISFESFKNKIPYFILTAIFAIIAVKAQGEAVHESVNTSYTIFDRLFLVSYSVVYYWFKSIFPFRFLIFYPYPTKPNGHLPMEYYLAFVALLALAYFIYSFGKKDKRIWWAGAFFIISISTVLQLLPVGSALVADRYAYLSSIGIFFLIGLLIEKYFSNGFLSKLFLTLGLIFLAGDTFANVKYWKNNLSLFDHAKKYFPADPVIDYNIGWFYLDQKDVAKAKESFERSEKNSLNNTLTNSALAAIYIEEKNAKGALAELQKIQKLRPLKDEESWLFGLAYLKLNEPTNAEPYLKNALDANKTNAGYWKDFAIANSLNDKHEEAKKAFAEAIKINPQSEEFIINQAIEFQNASQNANAIKILIDFVEIIPSTKALQVIGSNCMKINDWQKGIIYWEKGANITHDGEFEFYIALQYVLHKDLVSAKAWYIKSARKGYPKSIEVLKKNGDTY